MTHRRQEDPIKLPFENAVRRETWVLVFEKCRRAGRQRVRVRRLEIRKQHICGNVLSSNGVAGLLVGDVRESRRGKIEVLVMLAGSYVTAFLADLSDFRISPAGKHLFVIALDMPTTSGQALVACGTRQTGTVVDIQDGLMNLSSKKHVVHSFLKNSGFMTLVISNERGKPIVSIV